jgi:opacity protein-like surface antigen
MVNQGVGSARIVLLALAALVCAGLSACNFSDHSAPGTTASATSTSSTGSAADGATGSAPPSTSTQSVTLSWSPPTQNSDGSSLTNLAGYTLHYGTTSEDYTGSIEITSPTETSYTVSDSNFPAGTYYFAISAYNSEQVSSPTSSEVEVTLD